MVGTAHGVFKVRTLRRRPEGERWDSVLVQAVKGTPWKPYQHTDDERLLTRLPEPAEANITDYMVPEQPVVDKATPPAFKIKKKDVVQFGPTP